MLSDADRISLSDIVVNIDLARRFTSGLEFADFLNDTRALYAVIRALEIISEASRRLSPEIKARHPQIPWRAIAGSGNIYRHDYEDVSPRLVWATVHKALPQLRAAAGDELALP